MKSGTWNKKLTTKKMQLVRCSDCTILVILVLISACWIICWWCLLKCVIDIETVVTRPMIKNCAAAKLAMVVPTKSCASYATLYASSLGMSEYRLVERMTTGNWTKAQKNKIPCIWFNAHLHIPIQNISTMVTKVKPSDIHTETTLDVMNFISWFPSRNPYSAMISGLAVAI